MNKEAMFAGVAVRDRGITVKSPREIDYMRQAGKVVASAKAAVMEAISPGMTTRDLDDIASEEIKRLGAKPSFKGYLGFPATICVSVNEEIVHGIPGERVIRDGDMVSMDVGAVVEGFHGDSAVTVGVGQVSPEVTALIDVTKGGAGEGHWGSAPRLSCGRYILGCAVLCGEHGLLSG